MIMDDSISNFPEAYTDILKETRALGFEQLSDVKICSLVATLCRSKPNGRFLELGTGTGLSTSWMLEGMCTQSSLISVDNDADLIKIARKYLSSDTRLRLEIGAGETTIDQLPKRSIDLIFADTWPGKYYHLDEALQLLKAGGIYLIDDMKQQADWPDSHTLKAQKLVESLATRDDLTVTRINWSTGALVCVKK